MGPKQKEDADLMDILAVKSKEDRAREAAYNCYKAGDTHMEDAEKYGRQVKSMIVQFRDRKLVKDKDE
jgi:hypothetical protein